jgi:hypothetical protein
MVGVDAALMGVLIGRAIRGAALGRWGGCPATAPLARAVAT